MNDKQGIEWKGRSAAQLSNGVVRLVALNGGGHFADFSFLDRAGTPLQNAIWEAPWQTLDPDTESSERLSPTYGSPDISKFIAGYTGDALCLDYFGAALPPQLAAGLSLHGEAAVLPWTILPGQTATNCAWTVRLPHAGLQFERQISLAAGESVAYIRESILNENDSAHSFDWVHHATFGASLLEKGNSALFASAGRGISSPAGYDQDSLIAMDRDLVWPFAPLANGDGSADLRQPFAQDGKGFIAGFQLDPAREIEFVAAINWQLELGIAYCFRRQDYACMTVWEENHARRESPWNASTRARGMEFGTTSLPRDGEGNRGRAFASLPDCSIPARGTRTTPYIMFLFTPPSDMRSVDDVEVHPDSIALHDHQCGIHLSIPAHGVKNFLRGGN